mmetsp:Transcript_30496/g.58717  ORF Transcript_30496/g.58717 Transcript_30496/m.58717 type:complete len:296 (+) Transcript_30496:140-1027(+)
MNVTPETLAGMAGGAANIATGHPFDTVKVHMQHSPQGTFKNSMDCCRHIVRSNGVRGLYRGMAAPLLGGSLECGVNFGVFYGMNNYLQGSRKGKDMDASGLVISGIVSGTVLSFILAPTELVKCRMQAGAPPGHTPYSGPMDVIARILRHEGAYGAGMWRGLGGTLAREIPGNTVFFCVYEGMRTLLPRQPCRVNGQSVGVARTLEQAGYSIISGGVAGAVFWSMVLPIDGAKTRVQAALPGSVNDIGLWQHIRKVYRQAGARGLFAGLYPTVVRAFPANAVQWLVYELALQAIS